MGAVKGGCEENNTSESAGFPKIKGLHESNPLHSNSLGC